MSKLKKTAFSLIELTITMIMMGFLIGGTSITVRQRLVRSRDTARQTALTTISTSLTNHLNSYGMLPKPDNSMNIKTGNNTLLGYQGYFDENTYNEIEGLSNIPLDPKYSTPYIYNTNNTQNKFQLLAYLSNPKPIAYHSNKLYASLYWKETYPYLVGDRLGIFLDTNNKPAQIDLKDIDITTKTGYNILLDNESSTGLDINIETTKDKIIQNYANISCGRDSGKINDINSEPFTSDNRPTMLCNKGIPRDLEFNTIRNRKCQNQNGNLNIKCETSN